MTVRLLTEGEFKSTFTNTMTTLDVNGKSPLDFWPYSDAIPATDFQQVQCSTGQVNAVYETYGGRYQHVVIESDSVDVVMVLILIVRDLRVYGHYLLKFNRGAKIDPSYSCKSIEPKS